MRKKQPPSESFAQRLGRLLSEHDLTAYRLAQRSGLPKQVISRYLRGEREPTFANVLRIVQALEASLEVFNDIALPTKGEEP